MFTRDLFRHPFLMFSTPAVESGTPTDPPAGEPAPTDPPAATDPAPAVEQQPTDPPASGGGDQPETFSREYVEKLRRENAAAREKAKTDAATAAEAAKTELTQSLGKALGLIKDDEPADPAKLIQQAQAEREAALKEARSTKVQLAVLRSVDKHDANADELLDTASFLKKLDELDPTATDFSSQVDELIKGAVDSNPARFKRVQVASSAGGAQHTGETPPADPENQTVDDARAARQKRRGLT
jgi:hypothetical protein